MKKLILSGFLAVLGLAFVACGGGSSTQAPDSVAVSYVESVATGDAKKVLAFIDTSSAEGEAQEGMLEGKISTLVAASKAEIDNAGGLKEVAVLSKQENGEKANVEVEARFNDGTSKQHTIDLVKVKGEWKVSL